MIMGGIKYLFRGEMDMSEAQAKVTGRDFDGQLPAGRAGGGA
jgi:hypothetical protein